jgi:hypothetical protein
MNGVGHSRPVVIRAIKRLFGKGHEGPAGMSPEQAEVRLKGLKAQLTKNKSETKRISSSLNLAKNITPDKKAEGKARLKELDVERKEILREMKALHRRLPKK